MSDMQIQVVNNTFEKTKYSDVDMQTLIYLLGIPNIHINKVKEVWQELLIRYFRDGRQFNIYEMLKNKKGELPEKTVQKATVLLMAIRYEIKQAGVTIPSEHGLTLMDRLVNLLSAIRNDSMFKNFEIDYAEFDGIESVINRIVEANASVSLKQAINIFIDNLETAKKEKEEDDKQKARETALVVSNTETAKKMNISISKLKKDELIACVNSIDSYYPEDQEKIVLQCIKKGWLEDAIGNHSNKAVHVLKHALNIIKNNPEKLPKDIMPQENFYKYFQDCIYRNNLEVIEPSGKRIQFINYLVETVTNENTPAEVVNALRLSLLKQGARFMGFNDKDDSAVYKAMELCVSAIKKHMSDINTLFGKQTKGSIPLSALVQEVRAITNYEIRKIYYDTKEGWNIDCLVADGVYSYLQRYYDITNMAGYSNLVKTAYKSDDITTTVDSRFSLYADLIAEWVEFPTHIEFDEGMRKYFTDSENGDFYFDISAFSKHTKLSSLYSLIVEKNARKALTNVELKRFFLDDIYNCFYFSICANEGNKDYYTDNIMTRERVYYQVRHTENQATDILYLELPIMLQWLDLKSDKGLTYVFGRLINTERFFGTTKKGYRMAGDSLYKKLHEDRKEEVEFVREYLEDSFEIQTMNKVNYDRAFNDEEKTFVKIEAEDDNSVSFIGSCIKNSYSPNTSYMAKETAIQKYVLGYFKTRYGKKEQTEEEISL